MTRVFCLFSFQMKKMVSMPRVIPPAKPKIVKPKIAAPLPPT